MGPKILNLAQAAQAGLSASVIVLEEGTAQTPSLLTHPALPLGTICRQTSSS